MGIDAGDPAHPDCIAVPGADPANDLTPMATIRWQALGRQSDERRALSVVDSGDCASLRWTRLFERAERPAADEEGYPSCFRARKAPTRTPVAAMMAR